MKLEEPDALSAIGHIVGIASGKGGVGKSTVAAHLAVSLTQLGLRVGLLDADIYGPSQGMMFGVEKRRPEMREGMFVPIEAHGVQLMSMAFLVTEQTPMVWRGPMASGALQQMLLKTQWGSLDILLVDLPPGTGDIQLTLSQKARLSGAVIVTTPQDIAVLDAKKAVEMFAKVHIPVLGLIENMSFHRCSGCGQVDAVFGDGGGADLHASYVVPILGKLPLDGQIRQACDDGQLLSPDQSVGRIFTKAAKALLGNLEDNTGGQGNDPVIETVDH